MKSYLNLKPFDTLVQLPPELIEEPQAQDVRPDVEPFNNEFRLLVLLVKSVLLAFSRGQQRLYTVKYTPTSDSWGLGCHAVFLLKSVIIRLIIGSFFSGESKVLMVLKF